MENIDYAQERRDARFDAAVKRIDPAAFAQEIADLIAGESNARLCPFRTIVKALLDDPPVERLGHPYYSCVMPEWMLARCGREVLEYAKRAFETMLDNALEESA